MNSTLIKLAIALILGGFLSAACGSIAPPSSSEAEPTEIPIVDVEIEIVSEGRLVPRESVQLSFFTSGQVAAVLVGEGDQVKAGDVVARLGNREELEAAIANAGAELLAAQQALKTLSDDLPEAQTEVLQALNDARDAVRDTERRIRGFDVIGDPVEIEVARANVAIAKKALDRAEEDYKPHKNKSESNYKRSVFLNKVATAQDRYDGAVRELNRLTGVVTNDFELEQAETELAIAQSQLALAEEKHELLKHGPDPDDVASAEARIKAAGAALLSAKAALSNLELVATIDGTVVEQDLIIGQQVSAGQPVMTITDFSQMYAETDDLTEIEVVEVYEGQTVLIVPDALPEVEMTGTVETINDVSEEKRGEVTYTARIIVDKIDPRLRWGMTLVITFEK